MIHPFDADSGVTTVSQLLPKRVARTPDVPAYYTLDSRGGWCPTTWRQYASKVDRLASALRAHGLSKGDVVAIVLPSSLDWELAQMASMWAGATVVGIDPHEIPQRFDQIASMTRPSVFFYRDDNVLSKFPQPFLSAAKLLVNCSRTDTRLTRSKSMSALVESRGTVQAMHSVAAPGDIATIVFTSGVTGDPKGIPYTHEQICFACASILNAISAVDAGTRLLCWLPLSSLFQRIVNFCALENGASTYFVEEPADIVRHISTVNPHIFIALPRFYEKLNAGINDRIAQQPSWLRTLTEQAISVGDAYHEAMRANRQPGLVTRMVFSVVDRLFLKKIRSVMGSNIQFLISGSAPMPTWLLERYHAMGLLILEAYGLSENIVPNAMNRPEAYKFGTVGQALDGNELKVSDSGELLVRGPGIFRGYLHQDGSSDAFDDDGYLKTGDEGTIDAQGFVRVTGRISEIFKTSTGRKIAPAGIESLLQRIDIAGQVVVLGASRKVPIAIFSIVPDHCPTDLESLAPTVMRRARAAISALPESQRPAGLVLTTRRFTIDGGHLTSNLKLRRNRIEAEFAPAIARLYSLLDDVDDTTDAGESFSHEIRLCTL